MLNAIVGLIGNGGGAAGGDFESIATVSLTGTQATIDFSSIASTYKHLQIRAVISSTDSVYMSFNGDTTASNYYAHYLYGTGSAVTASANQNRWGSLIISTNSSYFSGIVWDILDYSSTSKYKTVRTLSGWDANGSGQVGLLSELWMNTATINQITLSVASGSGFYSGSKVALYGIKG